MWIILTAQIREEIYYSLISHETLIEEQKRCCKGTRDTRELLHIDEHILNERNMRRKNIVMAWIDYKKDLTYGPLKLDSKLSKCIKYLLPDEVIKFIEKTMETWRMELKAEEKSLREVKIQRGIFHEDPLSPLLFVIVMMTLNHIFRKCTAGYKFSKFKEKINHLIYMDDIKMFAKNGKELERLVQTIYCQDIETEFGIDKCAMLGIKSGNDTLQKESNN